MDSEISSLGLESCEKCHIYDDISNNHYLLLFSLRKAIISLSALALIVTLIKIVCSR